MSTPRTDKLFARHIDESCRARTDEARPDLWRIAKRQVEELLAHARQLEEELNGRQDGPKGEASGKAWSEMSADERRAYNAGYYEGRSDATNSPMKEAQ